MRMAHVIAFANQKGGTGKTTTCWHLGVELARRGTRVLLVDADPQSSLSQALGYDAPTASLATVLGIVGKGTGDLASIIQRVEQAPGLDIAPGDLALAQTELALVGRLRREYALADALVPVRQNYDYILVDAQPSLSLLVINVLVASDWIIIPTTLDVIAFRGLGMFLVTLGEIQENYAGSAKLLGVVASMTDLRLTHARQTLNALRQRADLRLFEAVVPRSKYVAEAAAASQTVLEYEPGERVATAIAALADEVIERVKVQTSGHTQRG